MWRYPIIILHELKHDQFLFNNCTLYICIKSIFFLDILALLSYYMYSNSMSAKHNIFMSS